jgi:predicted enzyme related to lactoylglutathione lyase
VSPDSATPGVSELMGGREPEPESLRRAYEEVCRSYHEISGFRAKLLGFLPLASGAGVILLLQQGETEDSRDFLGPIGMFGAVVTVALFLYELRGIQRCHTLEGQASALERRLALGSQEGQFMGQPERKGEGFVGPPGAAGIVYIAVVFAWMYVAGYGFRWWDGRPSAGILAGAGALYVVPQAVFWSKRVINAKRNRHGEGFGEACARTWEHTALAVDDLKRATDFYRKAFGYEVCFEEHEVNDEMGSMVGLPSVMCDLAQLRSPISGHTLELTAFRNLPPDRKVGPTQPGSGHVSFVVRKLPAALAAVEDAGATVVGDVTSFPDGSRRVYCRDPSGSVIELAERPCRRDAKPSST